MYIALEGIDTSGKSTQIELLKQAYRQAIFTKEPGSTPVGQEIREIILRENKKNQQDSKPLHSKTEFLLFLADRAEHISKIILPNYKDKLIFSDRSLISGIAYASLIPQAKELNLFATHSIIPDAVILLKIDALTLKFRLAQKPNDTIESRGIEYLLDVQNKLEAIAYDLGCKKLIILDASKDVQYIHTQIKEHINSLL